MVKAIHRKLLRDLVYLKGQATAIGLVMACGVATFVMTLSTLDSLSRTLDAYYQQNRFAHVFTHLKRAPQSLEMRISEIPGVAHVQTRVVERVSLDMPKLKEPASGQIISLPPKSDQGLNLLYLRSGRYPKGGTGREVLVSQGFARENDLVPGSHVKAILNGRLQSLKVVGIALSPEYIYIISPGSLFPEDKRFGVFWMARDEMESAFDMKGAFNDVVLSMSPGASEPEILVQLDHLTEAYGGLGAYGRKDQSSNEFLVNEIHGLRGMAVIMPIIFMGVAAFLMNIVISRIVATQREQIASLKALGYSKYEIGRHYLGFVMLITILAVILGSAVGAWMGYGMTIMYTRFFNFPAFEYTLEPRILVFGFGVSTAAAVTGVYHALRQAMSLPPAEAMRPLAPMSFHPTFLERMGVHRALPSAVRMILRQLERRPMKTVLSILGIALATAILVVGSFGKDAMGYLIDFQFNKVQRYDLDVALTEQTDDSILSSVMHMPGVRAIEPYRTVAVRIAHDHIERRIGIIGLSRGDGLHQLLDITASPVALPRHGVVISTALARILRVKVGDMVRVEAMQGVRPVFDAQVSGLIDDFSVLAAYMNLEELNRFMREQNTAGGLYLAADPLQTQPLYDALRQTPRVVAVNVKASTVANFRKTIDGQMSIMRPFMIGFSIVIAFGVIYNTSRISLSERSRDLATLRVLGFTKKEISMIQLGELAIITAIAIPFGLGMGYLLSWLTAVSTATELFQIPFIISPSTFAFAAIVVMIASVLSGLVVRRKLEKLDMVGVLKSRE